MASLLYLMLFGAGDIFGIPGARFTKKNLKKNPKCIISFS